MRKAVLVTLSALFFLCPRAHAQRGWAYVRDDDSEPLRPRDKIVVTLGHVRARTHNTFLTKVDRVGIVIQAKVSGIKRQTVDGNEVEVRQSASFPMAYLVPNPDKNKRHASLPFEQTFIPRLPLMEGRSVINNLTIEVDLAKVEGQSTAARVINRLLAVASSAFVPANPFATGVKYVVDFASGFVSDAIGGAGSEERIPLGTRSLNFWTKPVPKTGTYLLIDGPEERVGGGWVDPTVLSANNCLYNQRGANSTIMVGWKVEGASDVDAEGCSQSTYTPLKNAYVPILLQTEIPMPPKGVKSLNAEQWFVERREARLRQCADLGLSAAKCIAAHPR
jgi:hypothetical protein